MKHPRLQAVLEQELRHAKNRQEFLRDELKTHDQTIIHLRDELDAAIGYQHVLEDLLFGSATTQSIVSARQPEVILGDIEAGPGE
jgi:hypothetical protein